MTRKPGVNSPIKKESRMKYMPFVALILAIPFGIIGVTYVENNKSPEVARKQAFERCLYEVKTTGLSQRELTPEMINTCSDASNK